MNHILIKNLAQPDGNMDYKGLDIKQFVAGSQVYSPDFSSVHVKTTQDLTGFSSADVVVISEAEYTIAKDAAYVEPVAPVDLNAEIAALKLAQSQTDEILMNLMLGGA